MLQTVWLSWSEDLAGVVPLLPEHGTAPVLLKEDHLTMTLGALRVRQGDTIYFKAAVSSASPPQDQLLISRCSFTFVWT